MSCCRSRGQNYDRRHGPTFSAHAIYYIHVHNNKSLRFCNDACMCVSVSHLYTYKYVHQYNTAVDVSQGCMRGDGRGVRIMREGIKTGRGRIGKNYFTYFIPINMYVCIVNC